MYAIVISKSAAKDLEKISRIHLAGLIEAIDGLAENPRPAGCKKLKVVPNHSGEFERVNIA